MLINYWFHAAKIQTLSITSKLSGDYFSTDRPAASEELRGGPDFGDASPYLHENNGCRTSTFSKNDIGFTKTWCTFCTFCTWI